jgi:WD40 repeat protein
VINSSITMRGPRPLKVFISYARKDGAVLAQRLQADLGAQGFDAWLDTQRIAGGASWTKEIEQALDACQVALALLTPGSYVSEICRAEQLRALRKGKRVIPLLAQSGSDIPLHLETKNYRDFTGAKPYAAQFRLLLEDIRLGRSAVPLRPEFRTTYVTAPPLPRNYVSRPEALANLRNALITDGSGPSIALTALEGMGGIGKTILAQALCHDEAVQQAFPDGIVWITVGREPAHSLVDRMREVGKAVKDDLAGYDTELGCINRYRTVMQEKAALIVVDDVWRSRDVEPFRAQSPRSRLLFTTRDASIAAAVGAEELIADLLTPAQSRELLARWCGLKPEELPPEAEDIIKECGRLPLALAMIGAMLRGKPHAIWKHVVSLLRSADLEKIKAQFPDYPHTDLLRAVQVSVDALDAKARQRYLALAVLLEDVPIHPVVQQTLWGADEVDALETAEQFASLSLAQRVGDSGSIRLHDLQHDYVRAQYANQEALGLIRGAVRLCSHVVERDPRQFASQLVGRLLPHHGTPSIERFTDSLIRAAPRPWLRPLRPALHPPGTALVRILVGHSAEVDAVAMSPDGRRAVSASRDKTLKVWDLESGREMRTLAGHSNSVSGVAVSADGRLAVSASYDKTLKVWDLESGREVRTLAGHSGPVRGVALSADGRRAVSASGDQTLKVWDLERGHEVRALAGHCDRVNGVAVSAEGRRAVSASSDKTLKVWDLESGRLLHTLAGHSGAVFGVAVSEDGWRAVSASEDATLKVWDLESGRELRTLTGHSGWVCGVAMSADGRRAVSASGDQMLKVWDLETGRQMRALGGHSLWINGVAMSADGRQAVSASEDNTLRVWDLESGRELCTLAGHGAAVWGVAVSGDGRRAVSASLDATLRVWDLERGRALGTLAGHSAAVYGAAVSPDGQRAVSASGDRTLRLWDVETGRGLRTLSSHSGAVCGVVASPDGRYAISASEDRTLKVWDLQSGRKIRTLKGHSNVVAGVAVSVRGRRLVSASYDRTLRVWDLERGRTVRTLVGHSDAVDGVAVSEDGRRAVSASWDQTLKVWDLESGRELRTLAGHSDGVNGVAVTADGRRAVSASRDRTLKVWDLETGALVTTFTCDAAAHCCAFAGARKIVAGDAGGRVHFLSLELKEDGEPLAQPAFRSRCASRFRGWRRHCC